MQRQEIANKLRIIRLGVDAPLPDKPQLMPREGVGPFRRMASSFRRIGNAR
jgi:hypothetical protein